MIDWDEVDKSAPTAWITLSERLIDKSQMLLASSPPDEVALRSSQQDLGEFVDGANLQCPKAATTAIRRTSEQVTRALQAMHLADLALRNATFDAITARMSSAANELRADAAALRLEPARKALGVATEVAGRIKLLAAEVKSLRKEEIPAKVGELATSVEAIVDLIRAAVT